MAFKLPGGGNARIDETSVSLPVSLRSATDGAPVASLDSSDFTGTYWRQGGAATPIVPGPLAAVNSAYSVGGFIEVSAVSQPGTYRLDVPDAAWAQGADWVVIEVHAPTTAGAKMQFNLTEDGLIRSGTAQAGGAGTITLDANASEATQAYRNQKVHLVSGTGVLQQTRIVSSYDTATKIATVVPSWDSAPVSGTIFLMTNDYAPTGQNTADSLLSTNMGDAHLVQEALFALRNRVAMPGTGASSVGTVYLTDGTTSSYTFAVGRSNVSGLDSVYPESV